MCTTTHERLVRRGLRLEYVTLVWNVFEGAGALVAGLLAHSVALTAFGLDSSLEVFASLVAIWQLKGTTSRRDRTALRLIGACFLLVAGYVGIQATIDLVKGHHPGTSAAGVALTAAAAIVMLVLGILKNRVGRELDNPVLMAEARFSLVDAGLSATVLLGLVLNLALGWWWADAAAALVLAAYSLREAVEGLRA
jgi:divalent metal cation (Fe/Co/Zn/Cd) transporter